MAWRQWMQFFGKARTTGRRASRVTAVESLEPRQLLSIDTWLPRGPGGGGSLFTPAINSFDPNEIFISSDLGELFRSTDGGASWRGVDFRQLQGGTLSQVRFTNDPMVRYVLDASSQDGSELSIGARSGDGGLTWQHLTDPTESGELLNLIVDPAHPERVFVSDYFRMWVSQDSGQSWTITFNTSASSPNGLRLSGAFFDGDTITLGTNVGLLISEDSGVTFALSPIQVPAGEAILSFAGGKQDGLTRFFAITGSSASVDALLSNGDYYAFRHLYSLDLGQTEWTRFGGSLTLTSTNGETVNGLPMIVDMASNNVNVAYIAGGSEGDVPSVFKTTDGGHSWSSVLLVQNNENIATGWSGAGGAQSWDFGETAMGFAVSPSDPNRVLITDLGFAHLSEDGGTTWLSLNVAPDDRNALGTLIDPQESTRSSGLDNTSTWGVAWTDPRHVIGAYTDIHGAISDDGGQSWSLGYSGHDLNSMYRAVVSPTAGLIYAATSSVHDLYETSYLRDSSIDAGTGRIIFSADNGATWQTLHDFHHVVAWVSLDPLNPQRMYASVAHSQAGKSLAGGIWVSDNIQLGASSTWRKLTNPPRTQGHPLTVEALNDGTLVATYSARRTEPGATLPFTDSSGVFVSTDRGQTWKDRSAPEMRFFTKDLIVDPSDVTQQTWYAAVWTGWGNASSGGGLYRTTDRGLTWTKIFSASERVSSATISPVNPNELYVTTEADGLWVTQDLQAAAPSFTQDAAFPFRHPQRVVFNPFNPSEVWVTSFGNGLLVGYDSSLAGSIVIDSAHSSVSEAAGNVTATVHRIGGNGAIEVSYRTALGTATADSDYAAASGTLHWDDGDFSDRTITVPILDDDLPELTKSFFVLLSDPTGGATLGANYFAAIDIVDNDQQRLTFASPTVSIAESGRTATVTVLREGGSGGTMTVDYGTLVGSAKSGRGKDFTATGGTLTFVPGETAKTISIPILDDKLFEGDESFTLSLRNPRGGITLGDTATTTVTIVDQEFGKFVFSDPIITVSETSGFATVTVRRINGTFGAVSVNYAAKNSKNSTARAGRDYTAVLGTLNFADGQTSATFDIPIIDTHKIDKTRTVKLSLSNPIGGAGLSTSHSAKLKILDDEIAIGGVIQFEAANFDQNEDWGLLQATVIRTGDLGNITVTVSTSSGSAESGIDFQPVLTTIKFAQGERSKQIFISAVDDSFAESTETINLSLSNPTGGATLGAQASATISIIDNDTPAAISS